MVDADNSLTSQRMFGRTVKRREYGTPVDCASIVTPSVAQISSTFYRDNSPSYKKTFDETNKKNTNRRKIREKKKKPNGNQVNDKGVCEVNDIIDKLSLTLSYDKQSSSSSGKVRNEVKIKEPKIIVVPANTVTKIKSKPSGGKTTKVFTNSKFFSNETQLRTPEKTPNSSVNSTPIHKTPKSDNKKIFEPNSQTPKHKKKSSTKQEVIKFEEYITEEQIEEGLLNNELITGYLRINPKDYKTSYISNPNKLEQDIIIESLFERNRALDGDLVIVKYKKREEWRSETRKTGKVVYIKEKIHPRTAVGILKLMPDKNKQFACFQPRDSRFPRVKIPFTDWPALFYDNADKFEHTLFLVKIKDWSDAHFAVGNILENIGMSGDIKTETIAILKENCLDVTPYSDEMKIYYPSTGLIPDVEYKNRLDIRKECIFTIDPLTARDLDDAVSCKELPNGNLEIGVHIADVSFYLKENTPLNQMVSERATSTYMVESVYHMLPKDLCMLCSLLPGEDKLAFSVFWEITKDAEIVSHKFARTIMNSCVQLAYEHAQTMLENREKKFTESELPKIYNGYTAEDLSRTVNYLHNIAEKLRRNRFASGALRIDQPKLLFDIDPVTCDPLSFCVYDNKECHRLIEEFMLLANITVATRLKDDYPDIALLRSHPAPSELMMQQLQKLLEKVGIHIDITSSGGLQKSLMAYIGDDTLSQARMLVLSCLCAKTMTRAHYFCAKNCDDLEEYWHYALSIPLYTHFTSPIRRYADIMVHRLLAASLGYTEKPKWDIDEVCMIASNCNKQKFNAKRAGEQSIELYLIHYIDLHQPVVAEAVVMEVRSSSFDVIIMSSGISCRVFLNKLPDTVKYQIFDEDGQEILVKPKKEIKDNEEKDKKTADKKIRTLILCWPGKKPKIAEMPQIISLFSIVTVKLTKIPKKIKLNADLVRPKKTV